MPDLSFELPAGVELWMIGAGIGGLAVLILLIVFISKQIRKKEIRLVSKR